MKVTGILIAVLALAIGVVPLFTDCQSQGNAITLPNGTTIPMKCHWTGQAELATAGPLLALGGLIGFGRRRQTLRALSILGIVLGLFVILLPAVLIGVCPSDQMLCNMVMRPSLIMAGILVVAASIVVLLASRREAWATVDSQIGAE